MPAAQGTIRYSHRDRTLLFRVEGRGTMTQSVPMRQCVERLVPAGTNAVKIDLRDCTYMDSTFVGTLLTLRKLLDRHKGSLALLAPSDACERILGQMGLQDLLIREFSPCDQQIAWSELPAEPADPTSFQRTVTQAHEELAQLPGPAGEQFADVVRLLTANKSTKPPE